MTSCYSRINVYVTRMGEKDETIRAMKIQLTSLLVDDQEKALRFYTEVLGFVKRTEIPEARWLTVAAPQGADVEMLLEPAEHPAAQTYQQAVFEANLPQTAFAVDDLQAEYDRLSALGVMFHTPPTLTGDALIALFDDTCGNLIQLYQV